MAAEKILLGYGVVTVGTTPIGLTRGGSAFTVERKYRQIVADGDYGPVKGRQEIESETAKLEVNALELFTAADMTKYYPAMSVTPDAGESPTKNILTSTLTIAEGDYNDVKWVGKTKDGKAVTINVQNALNLDNLEWKLEDKSEVVSKIGFTAHYEEATKTTPPWNVEYAV
jgi:hypothetical protein